MDALVSEISVLFYVILWTFYLKAVSFLGLGVGMQFLSTNEEEISVQVYLAH